MDLDIIAKIAKSKIQEAIDEGKFDNLPGKGQPIKFDEDSSIPLADRLANKILRNAGVLPEWVQVRKDMDLEREEAAQFRARVIREATSRRPRLSGLPAEHSACTQFAEWHARTRTTYHQRLKRINTSVLKFSILAPSTAPPAIPVKITVLMESFDEEFPPLEHVTARPPAEDRESLLRNLARSRYTGPNTEGKEKRR